MKCRYFCRLPLDISPVYLTRGISHCFRSFQKLPEAKTSNHCQEYFFHRHQCFPGLQCFTDCKDWFQSFFHWQKSILRLQGPYFCQHSVQEAYLRYRRKKCFHQSRQKQLQEAESKSTSKQAFRLQKALQE